MITPGDLQVLADLGFRQTAERIASELKRARKSAPPEPIPMILHCPSCGEQHVDAPDANWDNPPHRSHLCHKCGTIWRPADVPTTGVERIQTKGSADRVVPLAVSDADVERANS